MSSHFTVIYDAGVLYPAPLRDFLMRLALTDLYRARQIKRYNLNAQHPDDFIFDLLDLHPARFCEAAANHRRSLKNPPKTADEYLDTLLMQGLTQTVGLLREWSVAI